MNGVHVPSEMLPGMISNMGDEFRPEWYNMFWNDICHPRFRGVLNESALLPVLDRVFRGNSRSRVRVSAVHVHPDGRSADRDDAIT
jgi:hypothetical protein